MCTKILLVKTRICIDGGDFVTKYKNLFVKNGYEDLTDNFETLVNKYRMYGIVSLNSSRRCC